MYRQHHALLLYYVRVVLRRLNMWVIMWVLSQYTEYTIIVYRKRPKTDSDALISRREELENLTEESIIDNPTLKKKVEEYDAGLFEKDLEEL